MHLRLLFLLLVAVLIAFYAEANKDGMLFPSDEHDASVLTPIPPNASVVLQASNQDDLVPDTLSIPESAPDDTVSSFETAPDVKTLSDTLLSQQQHRDSTDSTEQQPFARIAFAHQSLRIERSGQRVDVEVGDEIQPGDVIETCAKHFSLLEFPDHASMIIFPSSRLVYEPDGKSFTLKDAEIHFESMAAGSAYPDAFHCFDDTFTHNADEQAVSMGIHCRGESGVILTSKKGSLQWLCQGQPCELSDGQGLMGRVITANLDQIELPARTVISLPLVLSATADQDTVSGSAYTADFWWSPVPMTDRYLVHIKQTYPHAVHQELEMHALNRYSSELPGPGNYTIRVMAVDFYGVSGDWSDPVEFRANGDVEERESGEETIEQEPEVQDEMETSLINQPDY
ncbi:MAG: hypothetical protein R6U28_10310 [Cyclonatronaceae bacterium]